MKFVATGTNVWATFFDQHNTTKQAYTIPPAQAIPANYVFGSGQVLYRYCPFVYFIQPVNETKLIISLNV